MRLLTTTAARSARLCGLAALGRPAGQSALRYNTAAVAALEAAHDPLSGIRQRVRERIQRADAELRASPLTDTFNRKHTYLRISLTERCNLRCTYCMPADGIKLSPKDHMLTTPEILRLARLFVEQGVTKIRLTGGEPTVRKDLLDIIGGLNELKAIGLTDIGMTTNGIALRRKLPDLLANGLDQLNISLDTLKADRFEELTRRKGLDVVMESIKAAAEMNFKAVKINAVVMRHANDDELSDFVRLTRDLPVYMRFIEYMPFDGNKWNKDKFVSYADMLASIGKDFSGISKMTDDANDTSKAYQVDGFRGKFGFITSMSDHFCGTCNRVRLLADGNLKVCLFGNSEINLRDMLRRNASEDEILQLIGMAVRRKRKQHAVQEAASSGGDRGMERATHASVRSHRWIMPSLALPLGMNIGKRMALMPPVVHHVQSRLLSMSSRCQSADKTGEPRLTHVGADGRATMVDVSDKTETKRTAVATGRVILGPEAFALVRDNKNSKGDVLTVAQIAGIQGAKQTSNLIPLCHPLMLSKVKVHLELNDALHAVDIRALVTCTGRTGVEMEAMVAVSVAACTVYDMCKAVNKGIVISDIRLASKTGGKSGDFVAE